MGRRQDVRVLLRLYCSSCCCIYDFFNRFNIYIYDYCHKRGFHKTASQLLVEAEITTDPIPPINAKQGLLFECVWFFFILSHPSSLLLFLLFM
ncbi:hypothetical protein CPB84DRAFT_1798013, partial [Gymnopilus junonius]